MTAHSEFFMCLDDLSFSPSHLNDFVQNEIHEDAWYVFDCGKTRWTVQESYGTIRTECTSFHRSQWFQELYNLFTVPINFGDIFFTRTPPPGIPPHVDRNRPAAINLPVSGHFEDSPILFYDTFSSTSERYRFYHTTVSPITNERSAFLFNPQKIHGVINESDRQRCLLSFWWRTLTFDQVVEKWRDGSLINWSENEKNELVKVLRSQ
jgi:hypothetical protein